MNYCYTDRKRIARSEVRRGVVAVPSAHLYLLELVLQGVDVDVGVGLRVGKKNANSGRQQVGHRYLHLSARKERMERETAVQSCQRICWLVVQGYFEN
jgi:hypothetical protein